MTHDDLAAYPTLGCPRVRSVPRPGLSLNILEAHLVGVQRLLATRIPRSCCENVSPLLVLLFCCAVSCVPDNPPQVGAAAGGQATGVALPPPLDLMREQAWPAAYADDPLWRRASTGDDIDDARLAQRESASSLLVALEQGGSLGRTALRALGHASDRREARGELCKLLLGPDERTASALLEVLYELLMDAPVTEESVDSQADARCVSTLAQLSERERVSLADRDRAQVALARLRAP